MDELMIVKRDIWRAKKPILDTQPLKIPVKNLFLMDIYVVKPCESPDVCMKMLRWAQDLDMQTSRHRDIRYNYIIGGDGQVYEGRGHTGRGVLPSRFGNYLHNSLVIGFIGPLSKEEGLSEIMKTTYESLKNYLIEHDYLTADFEEHNILR